jgi:hypothetical protein
LDAACRRSPFPSAFARVPPPIAPPPGLEVVNGGVIAKVLQKVVDGVVGRLTGRCPGTVEEPLPLAHDGHEFRKRLVVERTPVARAWNGHCLSREHPSGEQRSFPRRGLATGVANGLCTCVGPTCLAFALP